MANVIAGLAAQLGLDTTEFKKGIGEAKSSLKELKEYLPEALSVAAFAEMIHASMELSNKIVETAKANEVTTASVLELSHALEENGGSAEDVSRIYSSFTQKVEAAVQGNATAQTSFAKLGVTLKDLGTLSEQDLFAKTVQGLATMKDTAERNGLAFQTLGKAIRGVDLKGLAASLEESKGEFDRYAKSVEMAHELSLKLEASHKQLVLEFTNAFIPSLLTLYESYTKTTGAMQKFAEVAKYIGMVAAATFKEITTAVTQVYDVIKGVFTYLNNIAHLDFSKAGKDMIATWEEIKKDGSDYVEFLKELVKVNNDSLGKVTKQQDVHRDVTASYSKQLMSAESLSAAYQKQADLSLLTLRHKEDALNMTKHDKEIQDEVNKVIENRDKQLASISQKIDALDMTKLGSKEIKATLEAQGVEIVRLADEYKAKTAEVVKANQQMRESFGFGWDQAFAQYKENAATAADYGRQSFQIVTNAMDNAIDQFVKKGKVNFKSLTESIIQGLIAVQLKMQANQLFGGVGGGFLSGIGDFLKGITGSSTVSNSSSSIYSLSSGSSGLGLKFADGGTPPVGQASLVGERGPELFVPNTSGTIIPNNMLGGMGGTTTNVTNYNIQAIDTKSFEDRIYGSASAVWAANMYATKNLATNRSRS
jgi:lambda family phage tail tape measure protein